MQDDDLRFDLCEAEGRIFRREKAEAERKQRIRDEQISITRELYSAVKSFNFDYGTNKQCSIFSENVVHITASRGARLSIRVISASNFVVEHESNVSDLAAEAFGRSSEQQISKENMEEQVVRFLRQP